MTREILTQTRDNGAQVPHSADSAHPTPTASTGQQNGNGSHTPATAESAHQAAKRYARAGLSVVQINPKTKRPLSEWKHLSTTPQPESQVAEWKNVHSFAVIHGAVSGGGFYLSTLDFESERFYSAWRSRVEDLADGLPVMKSGGGGFHVVFRSPLRVANEKLAWTPNDLEETGREIAIETRGEGGYIVAAPSKHPSGKPYERIDGDFTDVPVVSETKARALMNAARELCEAPQTRQQQEAEQKRAATAKPATHKANAAGGSVIDAFNAAHSIEDTLEKYGYTPKGDRYIRPGGHDASVVITEGRSFHHATNDPLHNEKHTHDPFGVFCFFEHSGDVKAAVKAAADALGLSKAYKSAAPGETPEPRAANDTRPIIDAGDADAKSYAPKCWDALLRASKTPRLFKMGPSKMRVEVGEGKPQLRELDEPHLIFELARAALFTKTKKRGEDYVETVVHPPREFARDLLADDRPPLPLLQRIVEAPVFSAKGELQTRPGYHEKSQTFFHAARGLDVPDVPEKPTKEEIEIAKEWILRPLEDFPFVGKADRANAIAYGLTPFARDMIDGPTPLGGLEATTAGTGKGLLADVILIPSIGRNAGTLTLGKDENDTKNRITAVVKSGKTAVLLDNVNHKVDSGALAQALTSHEWEDRTFITHDLRFYPVRCVWLMTANNPTMSTEIARRYVRIRLNAAVEQPWKRDGFEIDDLREWMKQNRGAMIWAYLTLIRAWQAAGNPRGKVRLGSYESWSNIIGGILENAGIQGFLGNLQQFYNDADTEGAAWRSLVCLWFETHGRHPITCNALFELALNMDALELSGKDENAKKKSLARKLNDRRDVVISSFEIKRAGTHRKGAALWCLNPLEPNQKPRVSADVERESADSADTCRHSQSNYAQKHSENKTPENENENMRGSATVSASVGTVGTVGTSQTSNPGDDEAGVDI